MKRVLSLFLALGLTSFAYADTAAPTQSQPSDLKPSQPTESKQSLPQDSLQSSPTQSQARSIQWFTKYSEALETAKKQNKPLLLFFTGSDWCGWCKKIDSEVFKDPEFIRLAGDRFVFVELDFPMNKMLPLDISEQNAQLKHKYGITGYPTVVVIQPTETFVAETGYRPGGGKAYAEYLNSLL